MYLFKIIGNKKHKMISKYENSSKITEKIKQINIIYIYGSKNQSNSTSVAKKGIQG